MPLAKNTRRFLWQGQPKSEWPYWLTARNYANDDERIVIHTLLEGEITARLGDTIVADAEQVISIETPA